MLAVLLFPCTATASTFYIDAFAAGGVSGTGGPIPTTGCATGGCEVDGYETPLYVFQPGDTVNFGTVLLGTNTTHASAGGPNGGVFGIVLGGRYGLGGPSEVDIFSEVLVQCNLSQDIGCGQLVASAAATILTVPLVFTLGPGTTSIQVFWSGPYTYVSPVPLPAALPFFATGLGALGLLGWRRKRKNTAAIAAA
jgi:hypothetical protein